MPVAGRRLLPLYLLLLLLLGLHASQAFFIFPRSPICSVDGLCDVTAPLGLGGVPGPVVLVCDWNGDRYTDLLTLNGTALAVHLWAPEQYAFASPVPVAVAVPPGGATIAGLAARDFDADGRLDLLLTVKTGASQQAFIFLREDQLDGLQLQGSPAWSAAVDDEPLASNLAGRGLVDLLGAQEGQRILWESVGPPGNLTLVPRPLPGGPLAVPHSASTVDLDGDCLPEVVTVAAPTTGGGSGSAALEVWSASSFTAAAAEPLLRVPVLRGLGLPTWADFDGDGDIDLIAPVQENGVWAYILVLYNVQQKSCGKALCCAATSFTFHAMPPDTDPASLLDCGATPDAGYLLLDLGRHPLLAKSVGGVPVPPRVRLGDINMDGYPDALVVAASTADGTTAAQLWLNAPCQGGACHRCGSPRTLVRQPLGTADLDAAPKVVDAFFFTFNEQGASDVMTVSQDAGAFTLRAFKNNYFNDAFFLKAAGTNGRGPAVKDGQSYGAAVSGVAFQFSWADLGGNRRVAAGTQGPTSAHYPLDLPHLFFGLGRTYSYVEQLDGGAFNRQAVHHKEWLGLVPNSNVYVMLNPFEDAAGWTLALFVSPSQMTFFVAVTFGAVLLLLAIPILVLHRWEKRRDDAERKAHAQSAFR